MTTICAIPYDTSASAFYFSTVDEYREKYAKRLPVEEYELQFIDGDNPKLFSEAGICQSNLENWFESLDNIEDDSDDGISLRYLLSMGYTLTDALSKFNEVMVFRGKPSDYAYEIFEDSEIPEHLANYIDYDAIARDMEINGEIAEFSDEIIIANAQEL
jgi:hypothetical protein